MVIHAKGLTKAPFFVYYLCPRVPIEYIRSFREPWLIICMRKELPYFNSKFVKEAM